MTQGEGRRRWSRGTVDQLPSPSAVEVSPAPGLTDSDRVHALPYSAFSWSAVRSGEHARSNPLPPDTVGAETPADHVGDRGQRVELPRLTQAYSALVSIDREELHRLVDALPEEQVAVAMADVRRRVRPQVPGSWPPPWVGSIIAGRTDVARNYDDILAEGFGRS